MSVNPLQKRNFKTSKQLTIQKMYRKWEDYAVGDVLIGKIIGWHTDQYGKRCPIVKVLDAQFKKDAAKYQGANLVINSSGMLDKALKDVQEGEIIQVEYRGTAEIQKGPFKGQDAHVIDVQIVVEDDGSDEEEVDL